LTHEAFRERMAEALREMEDVHVEDKRAQELLSRVSYHGGGFGQASPYEGRKETLAHIDAEHGTRGDYLFYLATPPDLFAPIVHELGRAGLVKEDEGGWRRAIVEKPFGKGAGG